MHLQTHTYIFTAHKFVKTYLSGIENKESPMNCSAAPFQNNVLTNAAYPGEATGPLCQCADSYFASEAAINSLIQVKRQAMLRNTPSRSATNTPS